MDFVAGRSRRSPILLLLLAVAALLGATAGGTPAAAPSATPGDKPRPTDQVERAGVTLLLLDVEAVDRKGRPMRGLTKDDFQVRLDFHPWPIYSVDDLCGCGGDAGEAARTAGGGATPRAADANASPAIDAKAAPEVTSSEPRRFVLYFEFSQMRMDGRRVAVREAKRWIEKTMQPDDEVMLAAASSLKGLRRLTPFTHDRSLLTSTLDEAYEDRGWMDTFAMEIGNRMGECAETPPLCYGLAMQEYQHARSAMRMLQDLLAELERTPGRKNLILFSQNGATYPDVFYGHPGAPDLYAASQELAAAATGSQTVMYGANLESDPWSPIALAARELNDNFADFTGGGFNRGAIDLARFTDRVGRGCHCVYRIGLVPPKSPTTEVRTAKVVARGVPLDFRYRIRFPSERERWMRDAQAVLADPAGARALKVSAAIVPESAERGSWSVAVEVAFDTRSLTLLPSAAGRAGGYEIGALLSSRNGSKPVEMIEGVNLREREGQDGGGLAVHTLKVEDLDPGDYRLAAFVRDRALNVFGGAEALLTLPSPRRGGAAGPVLLLGPQPRTVLPLGRRSSGGSGGPSPRPAGDAGVVPMSAGDLRPGERLSGMTWICPGKKKDAPKQVLRFLAQEGTPLFRFESSPPVTAGECLLYADVLDTGQVKADAYAYHVLWRPDGEPQPVDASAVFEIVDPGRERAAPAASAERPPRR